MKSGKILLTVLLNLLMFALVSIITTATLYVLNLRLFSSWEYFPPTDASFLEGLLFLIVGFLFLFGRGGISLGSTKAAILSAVAGYVYGKDAVGPDEMLRRDRWQPKGFIRAALILIMTGVFMILIYFLNL